ncbi:ubiquitin-associated protein 1-like [Chanos chanos]|uniref:Ubiquitin-associated protein 1-like n=1 Tax=Chanos chanos TaxID=29144 RepID=A0A6J2WPV0_CHACN|nr:ubiquitin-associated protein 1-like [Chanos chanos]
MNALDELPFKIPVGDLDEPLEMQPITVPDIQIPDYRQILRETEYEFSLENWVLTGQQAGYCKNPRSAQRLNVGAGAAPSCPPYWLMFSSPQQSRLGRHRSGEFWDRGRRPRSLSLSSADSRWLPPHRSVKFLISDSECDAGGYSEDDEGSSTEEDCLARSSKTRERPQSAGPKQGLSRLRELKKNTDPHVSHPSSPRGHHRSKTSVQELRQASLPVKEQPKLSSPRPADHGARPSRRKPNVLWSGGKRHSSTQQRVNTSTSTSTFKQTRPSSAGPAPSTRRQKPSMQSARPKTSHGRGSARDSSTELLCALSQDERELLEAITAQGYPVCTAIMALQRTGCRSPEQILSYLVACEHLCELGYDKTQVEEALEMFQNCETKAAEFLRLLAQFNEMGFQQNAIKEVLLVHENHRERALEELMTRVS